MNPNKYPTTRLGWHKFYVKRFNKNGSPQALHMAMWYLNLAYCYGEIQLDIIKGEDQIKYLKKLISNKARDPKGTRILESILEDINASNDAYAYLKGMA